MIEVLRVGAFSDRMSVAARRRMLDTLEAQRRVWNQRRPRAYVIRSLTLSDCVFIQTRSRARERFVLDRLVVRDTTIVAREPAPIAAPYEQRCPIGWRVDDLFADVTRALADTTAYIEHIEYDPAYGFPRAYWIGHMGSRGARVVVESFAPAP